MKFRRYSDNSFSAATSSPEETFSLGKTLGENICPGLLLLLKGTLGMGKTKFTQGIGAALGAFGVKSPTFVIMREYDVGAPFLHVDLYRIDDEAEIESLGIEEYLEEGFAAAVEWAEKWKNPPDECRIDVEFAGSGENRLLTFTLCGEEARGTFEALAENIEKGSQTEEF